MRTWPLLRVCSVTKSCILHPERQSCTSLPISTGRHHYPFLSSPRLSKMPLSFLRNWRPEAYNKVELNIIGNGTHLAPLHPKLGFQPRPTIVTLHALTRRGDCTLSRTGCDQGMYIFVFSHWTDPDSYIGLPCCLHRVSRGR